MADSPAPSAPGEDQSSPGGRKTVVKRVALTAWTVFLWIFRSPTMLTLVAGFSLGYWGGWQAGHGIGMKRAAKAEAALHDYRAEVANAIAFAAQQQITIRDDVRQAHEDAKIKIDALSLRVNDLRRNARVCDSTSTLPVPTPSTGVDSPSDNGQPRPAVDVLQDLAADIAKRCDGTAAQLNGLIEWLYRTRNEAGLVENPAEYIDKAVTEQLK